MINSPEGRQTTQADRARAVAQAAVSMLEAHDRYNRLEEDDLLRDRYDPDAGPRRDTIAAARA